MRRGTFSLETLALMASLSVAHHTPKRTNGANRVWFDEEADRRLVRATAADSERDEWNARVEAEKQAKRDAKRGRP